jgi:4-amino-4-deoxychorismate lyase
MSRFIESIKLENGQFFLLPLHEKRMNQTRRICLGLEQAISLDFLPLLGENYPIGLFKCRIVYAATIEKIEILPYQARPIESLKIVAASQLDYTFKSADRTAINALFQQRKEADDVLIIKNGFVTDTSYCNVAFFDGKRWFTPNTPLLKGVQRQFLLDNALITAKDIALKNLFLFEKIKLFNAMMDWEVGPEIFIRFVD